VARILREVVITIPTSLTVLERVDLQYLCSGMVSGGSPSSWASTCAAGTTCIAGACADDSVDGSTLGAFDPSSVFGGGSAPGEGQCFDVSGCFADPTPAGIMSVDGGCAVVTAVPTGTSDVPMGPGLSPSMNLNLGLHVSSGGTCNGTGCYVPLDQDKTIGWSPSGDSVLLPPGICQALTAPGGPTLVVSSACATKVPGVPICTGQGGGMTGHDGGVSLPDGSDDGAPFDASGPPDAGTGPSCPADGVVMQCSQIEMQASSMTGGMCQPQLDQTFSKFCMAASMQSGECACLFQEYMGCLAGAMWTCDADGVHATIEPGCMQRTAGIDACPGGDLGVDAGAGNPTGCPSCPAGETCMNGACVPAGCQRCPGSPACVDLLSDPSNCGMCGNLCIKTAPNCKQGICSP
jgi:hypothetical protein